MDATIFFLSSVCFTTPAYNNTVHLVHVLNTEIATVSDTAPFNMVRRMVVKIR